MLPLPFGFALILVFASGFMFGVGWILSRKSRRLFAVVKFETQDSEQEDSMQALAMADDQNALVTFVGTDDRGNPTGPLSETVTMTSSDETVATIGVGNDGSTQAIKSTGKLGTATVTCTTPSGLSDTINVAVGTSAPTGFGAQFTLESQTPAAAPSSPGA